MGGASATGFINYLSPAYIFAGDLFMDRNKRDYLIRTLGIQALICILLFALLFGLRQSGKPLFSEIKEMFSENLKENITPEEAQSVFGNLVKEKPVTNATEDEDEVTEYYEYTPPEEPSLSAEVIAEGGADVTVCSSDEVPDNVSVAPYSLNQKMVLPLKGTTTSEFGVRTHPISGDLRFHAGTDIAADMGTPVYAAFDGTVTVAQYDRWNGNYIKLRHDNGIMTVYCHCERLKVKAGQVIRAGEVIATVGSTGSSTGPHLHFELSIDGKSYNPEIALNEAVDAV